VVAQHRSEGGIRCAVPDADQRGMAIVDNPQGAVGGARPVCPGACVRDQAVFARLVIGRGFPSSAEGETLGQLLRRNRLWQPGGERKQQGNHRAHVALLHRSPLPSPQIEG
jgi:hypothetical protein